MFLWREKGVKSPACVKVARCSPCSAWMVPWVKLLMMAEEAISLIVGVLVVARAVNILK